MAPTSPLSSASVKGATVGRNISRGHTPDVGVTGLDHLGQLGQVDAGRLGQHLALVGGQPRSVGDQVAGQLGRQARSERAHGHRQRANGVEDRRDPGDDLGVAADHADQLTGGGARSGRR